jgi:hypothetical protein
MRGRPISRILCRGLAMPHPLDDHSSDVHLTMPAIAANPDLTWGKSIPVCLATNTPIPIWHCSRWGLPCRCCCQRRGGLLLHRFTLTVAVVSVARPFAKAVSFLWRCPSGCPARALPGTVPFWSPDFPRYPEAAPRSSSPPRKVWRSVPL